MNDYYSLCCYLAWLVGIEPPKDADTAKAWFNEYKEKESKT